MFINLKSIAIYRPKQRFRSETGMFRAKMRNFVSLLCAILFGHSLSFGSCIKWWQCSEAMPLKKLKILPITMHPILPFQKRMEQTVNPPLKNT